MNVVNLDTKKFAMTLVINLDATNPVINKGNEFNNSTSSTYLTNLIGYYKIKITRFEVTRETGGSITPLALTLVSPAFKNVYGNYPYPTYLFSQNVTTVPIQNTFVDVGRAICGDDSYYIYNFSSNMELFIADIYAGYTASQNLFDYQSPLNTKLAILSLEVEKM